MLGGEPLLSARAAKPTILSDLLILLWTCGYVVRYFTCLCHLPHLLDLKFFIGLAYLIVVTHLNSLFSDFCLHNIILYYNIHFKLNFFINSDLTYL